MTLRPHLAALGLVAVAFAALGPGAVGSGATESATAPHVVLPSKKPSAALVEQVQAYAKAQVGPELPAIWIGVWDPKRGSYSYAYGTAAPGRAATVNDVWRIGSITKTFTATVILQLVDQGKLTLADTVADVDPALAKRFPPYAKVTIRQLLAMRSGIEDYLNGPKGIVGDITARPRRTWTADELIAAGIKAGVRPPGTTSYSTTNYIVLQRIAEKITGSPLRTLIRTRVTAPLGLRKTVLPRNDTTALSPPATRGRLNKDGVAEIRHDGGTGRVGQDTSSWSVSSGQGGGAMQSNLHELGVWAASDSGSVLLAKKTAAVRARTTPLPPFGYGLGLMKLGPFVGHEGEWFGWEALALHDPKTDRTVVVAGNAAAIGVTLFDIAGGIYPDASLPIG